jgi:HEAT repeat protein
MRTVEAAEDERPAPRRGPPLSAADLETARAALRGSDMAAAQAAIKKLAESRASNAAEPLVEMLAVGTSPALAQDALVAMAALEDPRAIQILTLYSGNRNIPVRLAALRALAALPDDRVAGTLIERLGDSASEVRKVAAEALAARKDKRAGERLFKLVARNDVGAAAPLGILMAPDEAPKLAELRGRIDDPVLATALGELVKRPEVADRLRLEIVRTLGQIPGAASTAALVEYLASIPENDPRPSREEAQKLVDQRGGGK